MRDQGGDSWDFYKNTIYPHKGKLEQWYQVNQSFWTDIKIIFATALAVVRPESDIVDRWFDGIPKRDFFKKINKCKD